MSICDLDSDAGENACEELGQTFGKERVFFCHCDVTDYVQFEEAFQTTIGEFDGLDIVVNNAEIMNDKFWELEVDVNLVNKIKLTHRSELARVEIQNMLRFFIYNFRTAQFAECSWHCNIWAKIRKVMVVSSSILVRLKAFDRKYPRPFIVPANMRF